MRDALRGLTTRGRCFLAAAAAAVVSALVLGERDLLRVAVLLAALPLFAAFAVSRTRYRLSCTRTVDPDRTQAGSPARVTLRLENLSRVPSGVMLLEEQLPYVLGGRPRFVLDRLRGRQAAEVAYVVHADARGRYELGPLSVRLTDPFGLCELARSFSATEKLVVTPVVHPLPPVRIAGERTGSGESRARSIAVHGEDDAATREYRNGDDLRKVHWRSTARVGELMVRREEQPWHSTAVVLLDTRVAAHRGDGPTSSFEWAVSAAGSVALHLGRAGYILRLVTDDGVDLDISPFDGEGTLLDLLADVRGSRRPSIEPALAGLRGGRGGVLVAVLGALGAEECDRLAASRPEGGVAIAVLVDTAGWVGLTPQQKAAAEDRYAETARRLTGAGWRVLSARHGGAIADLWPLAGMRSTQRLAGSNGAAAGSGTPVAAGGVAAGDGRSRA
jgi:uncharacterized protein (DUF58 family)